MAPFSAFWVLAHAARGGMAPRHVCKRPECTSRRFQTQIENFSGMTTLHRSRLALHRCIKSQRSIQQLVYSPLELSYLHTHISKFSTKQRFLASKTL